MSWELLGTVTPGRDWQYLAVPITSRLFRLSYAGDAVWLEKNQPRAFIRLKIGADGSTKRWETIWPKHGETELIELNPIPIDVNYFEIRKRRNFESLAANYSLTVEEFQAMPYLINYEPPYHRMADYYLEI